MPDLLRTLTVTMVLCGPVAASADHYQVSVKRVPPAGIDGSLVLVGGGKVPDEIREQFVRLAGGKGGRLVVIPTASTRADKEDLQLFSKPWKAAGFAGVAVRDGCTATHPSRVAVLHTRDRKQADDPGFTAPLKTATAVWFSGGSQQRIADAYLGTAVERELHALLKRGGVIGGTSAGAAVMSRVMIARGNPQAGAPSGSATGFDLLPDAVIDQHFTQRKRRQRLAGVLKRHPGRVGIGIDEGTALIVRGRRMTVVGKGNVTILLAANGPLAAREFILKPKDAADLDGRSAAHASSAADLTALRRAAVSRTLPPYPMRKPPVPNVTSGSLVIVGGGGMTADVAKKFVDLAGGPDALIVYLPTAVPERQARRARVPSFLRRAGAKNVQILPQCRLQDVEQPSCLAVLKKARGLWFGGGRQWRFIDAYAGTRAEPLFHDVLKRGGVIGGSSAGASIQGGYLARANPLGNRDIMADGYERGLNFLPGVAIDQHFAQRKRFRDMTQLMQRYPQLLGIGLDEATAIVVQKSFASVMGRGQVHFYDRRKPVFPDQPDYESLRAGDGYDLKARRCIPRPPVEARKPHRRAA